MVCVALGMAPPWACSLRPGALPAVCLHLHLMHTYLHQASLVLHWLLPAGEGGVALPACAGPGVSLAGDTGLVCHQPALHGRVLFATLRLATNTAHLLL